VIIARHLPVDQLDLRRFTAGLGWQVDAVAQQAVDGFVVVIERALAGDAAIGSCTQPADGMADPRLRVSGPQQVAPQ